MGSTVLSAIVRTDCMEIVRSLGHHLCNTSVYSLCTQTSLLINWPSLAILTSISCNLLLPRQADPANMQIQHTSWQILFCLSSPKIIYFYPKPMRTSLPSRTIHGQNSISPVRPDTARRLQRRCQAAVRAKTAYHQPDSFVMSSDSRPTCRPARHYIHTP